MKSYILGAGLLLLLFCGSIVAPTNAQGLGQNYNGFGGQEHRSAVHWSGNVDDRVVILIHGSNVHSRVRSGDGINNEAAVVRRPLPDAPVTVYLSHATGRGQIRILRQPDASNNYTAAVAIDDPQAGRSFYSFSLDWR